MPLPITTGARPAATAASLRGGKPGTALSGQPGPVYLRDQLPGAQRGSWPYRARWPSRLAGRGGSRRGSAPGAAALDDLTAPPGLAALCVTAAPFRARPLRYAGALAAVAALPGQQPGQAGGRDRGGAAPHHQRHPSDPQVGAGGWADAARAG